MLRQLYSVANAPGVGVRVGGAGAVAAVSNAFFDKYVAVAL